MIVYYKYIYCIVIHILVDVRIPFILYIRNLLSKKYSNINNYVPWTSFNETPLSI